MDLPSWMRRMASPKSGATLTTLIFPPRVSLMGTASVVTSCSISGVPRSVSLPLSLPQFLFLFAYSLAFISSNFCLCFIFSIKLGSIHLCTCCTYLCFQCKIIYQFLLLILFVYVSLFLVGMVVLCNPFICIHTIACYYSLHAWIKFDSHSHIVSAYCHSTIISCMNRFLKMEFSTSNRRYCIAPISPIMLWNR